MSVIDASVAVKWFVEEDGHEAAFELLNARDPKWAPDFALAEIANVRRKKLKAGQASTNQVDRAVASLPELFAYVVPTSVLIHDAWQIAQLLDHSVYDCLYLACAEQHGLKLVTADRRFLDKAQAKGRAISITLLPSSPAAPASDERQQTRPRPWPSSRCPRTPRSSPARPGRNRPRRMAG